MNESRSDKNGESLDSPAIPENGERPATDIPPPSRHLGREPQTGMVSQADLDNAPGDETLRRQRRENINPSLARGEPPEDEAGGT